MEEGGLDGWIRELASLLGFSREQLTTGRSTCSAAAIGFQWSTFLKVGNPKHERSEYCDLSILPAPAGVTSTMYTEVVQKWFF